MGIEALEERSDAVFFAADALRREAAAAVATARELRARSAMLRERLATLRGEEATTEPDAAGRIVSPEG